MRRTFLVTIFGALPRLALSHFVFPHIHVNGVEAPEWKYVRDVRDLNRDLAPGNTQYGKTLPQYNFSDIDITCGRPPEVSTTTETAVLKAGDHTGFRVQHWYIYDYLEEEDSVEVGSILHPGPVQVYMSLAPDDDIDNYNGDGDWFKVASYTYRNDSHWIYGNPGEKSRDAEPWVNFTIPETTPPGKYLARIEHMWPTTDPELNQWFVNCAQIEVKGSGSGSPGPLVKFPGAYKFDTSGITIPESAMATPPSGLTGYIAPGPLVWQGQ